MSSMGEVMVFTAKGVVDFTNLRYHMVRLSAANEVNISSESSGSDPATLVGVAQTNAVSGRAINVGYFGESKVVAGGSITVGRWISATESGRAVAAASGDNVIGQALTAPAADGDVFRALIFPVWRLTGPPS